MLGQNWLSLVTTGSLQGELMTVVQPRKLFRLGVAFLTRVRDELPTSSDHVALDVTRRYADGKAGMLELVEAWTTAELDGGEGIWSSQDFWCECCGHPSAEEWPYLPDLLQSARHPHAFASYAAFVALRLAGGTYHQRLGTVNQSMIDESAEQFALCRDLIGDECDRPRPSPVRLAELPDIRRLLAAIDRDDAPDALALLALADALEEAGCEDESVLRHLRAKQSHFAGCWAVERVAGREMIRLRADPSVLTPRGRHASRRVR